MNTLPKSQLILGYKEFFNGEIPDNRIDIVRKICKKHLITELAGLNYRLKPKDTMFYNNSKELQATELKYFSGDNRDVQGKYFQLVNHFEKNNQSHPIIFTRQTCLFGFEEIIQSDIKVIPDFEMKRFQVWDAIFKYLLSVNSYITKFESERNEHDITIERLNPKMIPLNELSLNTDPFNIPLRGFKLLKFLEENKEVSSSLKEYLNEQYSYTSEELVFTIMSLYLGNEHENKTLDFYYPVDQATPVKILDILSNDFKSTETHKLLRTRKFPFYKSESGYVLSDNIILLEKIYNQFINDFWFDYIKPKRILNIKKYKSIIGYFFENYVKELIDFSFANSNHYVIKQFNELNINIDGNQIELADIYVRKDKKIILGQVKSSTLYDDQKYGGDLESLYKDNREEFFKTFGLTQLVSSLQQMNENISFIDSKFPKDKQYRVFPVIIVNEKALQTPLMSAIFQDSFEEQMMGLSFNKIHIYPISIIHVGDLESIQDHLNSNPNFIWDLLKYHCRNKKFMPPFYNSVYRKNIKSDYGRTFSLLEKLIAQFNPEK
jgi:hypothetical protein